jgi:hypothetical protein
MNSQSSQSAENCQLPETYYLIEMFNLIILNLVNILQIGMVNMQCM